MKIAYIAFALSCSLLASAQEFTAPIRVNSDTTGADREPWMHVGQDGKIYISWVKAGHGVGGDIYFSRSDDKGATFIPSVRVTNGATINADLQRGAPFAVDTKGIIHMVWVEKRVGTMTDAWHIRSTDGGITWTDPVSVSDDSTLYMQDFPSVACDSSDNVYISFLDSRDRSRGVSNNEQLYMVKSTDKGVTWSSARKVNAMPGGMGGTCECCKQDIQAGPNGHVTIAFRTNIMNRRDIFVVRSTDFGQTFSEAMPIQMQQWTIDACPATGPNTHLTPEGDLYLAWRDARDAAAGKAHVYYDVLPLGATEPAFSIVNNIRLDINETLPNWPDISIYKGYRAIAFETNTNRSTYALLGEDGIPYFTIPLPGPSDKQFMCTEFATDGTRYFAWQDKGFATNDIVFMKDISELPSLAVHENIRKEISVTPNPVKAGSTFTLSIEREDNLSSQYSIIDILGRIIYEGNLQITDGSYSAFMPVVSAGQYIVRLSSGQSASIVVIE